MLCCAVLVCSTCRPVHSTCRAYTRDLVCDYLCPPVWSNDPTTDQAGLHSIPPPGSHITTRIQPTDVQGYDLDQLTLHSLPSTLQRPRHRLRLDQIWSEGLGDQYKTRGAHTYTWSTLHDNPTPRHHYQPTRPCRSKRLILAPRAPCTPHRLWPPPPPASPYPTVASRRVHNLLVRGVTPFLSFLLPHPPPPPPPPPHTDKPSRLVSLAIERTLARASSERSEQFPCNATARVSGRN